MVIFVMWCVLYYTPFLVNLLSGKISIGLHLQKVACPQRVDFWSLVHIPPQEVVEICFEISKMSQPRHYILLVGRNKVKSLGLKRANRDRISFPFQFPFSSSLPFSFPFPSVSFPSIRDFESAASFP